MPLGLCVGCLEGKMREVNLHQYFAGQALSGLLAKNTQGRFSGADGVKLAVKFSIEYAEEMVNNYEKEERFTTNNKLAICPFCGKEPILRMNTLSEPFVYCSNPQCFLHHCNAKLEKWNIRYKVTTTPPTY